MAMSFLVLGDLTWVEHRCGCVLESVNVDDSKLYCALPNKYEFMSMRKSEF